MAALAGSEVLLEEGEAGPSWRAHEVRVLHTLVGQLLSNHRGAAEEDADVLTLVLLAVLLEDAAPVGAAEELPSGAGEPGGLFKFVTILQNLYDLL